MTDDEKQELLDLMAAENERLAKINSKPSQ
jgi:hypothetical protein